MEHPIYKNNNFSTSRAVTVLSHMENHLMIIMHNFSYKTICLDCQLYQHNGMAKALEISCKLWNGEH